MKGKFITFEGCDGSGKTTQSKLLHRHFSQRGIECLWTREIGGTPAAERIRDVIMGEDLLDTTELLLIMAARFEHVEKVIKLALVSGKTVICDRFIDSTMAYQGIDLAWKLHEDIFSSFMPYITFFVDLDPEVAIERAMQRGDSNKFDKRDITFHKKVYGNFRALAQKFPNRIVEIDGAGAPEEVHQRVLSELNSH
jgi:dTMP kinase